MLSEEFFDALPRTDVGVGYFTPLPSCLQHDIAPNEVVSKEYGQKIISIAIINTDFYDGQGGHRSKNATANALAYAPFSIHDFFVIIIILIYICYSRSLLGFIHLLFFLRCS